MNLLRRGTRCGVRQEYQLEIMTPDGLNNLRDVKESDRVT